MADKIKKFFQKKKADAKFKLAGKGHRLSESTISQSSNSSKKEVPVVKRSGLSEESKVAAEAALARLQQRRENPSFNTSLAAIQDLVCSWARKLSDLENSLIAANDPTIETMQLLQDEFQSFKAFVTIRLDFLGQQVCQNARQIERLEAQVKKELENEKASHSKAGASVSQQMEKLEIDDAVPRNLVASGVYFKCPLISNDILPRDEWKRNIKTFLYEQLEEERGLTACLIIQSCNNNREKIDTCVETLCKYLENIVNFPEEEKYQKIRMTNRAFCERVQPIEGAMELLLAAGFTQKKIPNAEGLEEDFLVFDKNNVPSIESLTMLIDALRSAEPIQLELDRNLQVLLPSQAACKVQLPPSFYTLTPEELKREQQLRQEVIEKSQLLRTKAMRERDEMREIRKYKFAIIRVRFPDGILLQGTFSVYERYNEIHEFVQENLEHSDLPFILNTPTGHKLVLEEDANKTLIDLRLVPATVLTFAWDSSVVEQVNSSPNRDVYLKPEVMVLVQEI